MCMVGGPLQASGDEQRVWSRQQGAVSGGARKTVYNGANVGVVSVVNVVGTFVCLKRHFSSKG